MADFMRPEARATLIRWREVIVAAAVALFGIWWATQGVALVRWLGVIVIALGAVWIYAAVQRVRFAQDGAGPGVVQVKERRLAYFGPLDGGVMDVEDLTELRLDPSSHPTPTWVLTAMGGQRLTIPINAAGADVLFDVFSGLPGIETAKMLDVLSRTPAAPIVIWSRLHPLLH